MRFWHKILLSVLALFIAALDVSVIMVMKKSWQLNMDSEMQRASSEQLLIANNIYENLNSIQARGTALTPILLASVSESYGDYYRKQGIYLQLWENDRMIYPPQKGQFGKSNLGKGDQPVSSDERSIQLSTQLPAPYQHLLLVYQRDISELFNKQQELNRFFVMINWIVGPVLLLLLYLLIRHLSKPLKLLSETSKTIAEGDYTKRVQLRSKDEFGELALNFNRMAEAVEQRVTELSDMAEEKQRMVDNLAHELRTPLTSMQGFAEFLTTANIGQEEQQTAGGYILSETLRLKNLAFKLLDLSVLRHQPLALQQVDISELFQAIQQTERPKLTDASIRFHIQHTISNVWGDPDLLASLLVNLVENAIHASKQGSEIHMLAYELNGEAVLEIRDTGTGITAEMAKRVFEPFYRGDQARSREYGGAGLGLSLCRQIAEAHKARLSLNSVLGEGTSIRLFLQLYNNCPPTL
ncbi:HAMP domain-containing sensor histidine kinase [Paenibacillus sp. FSL R5-0744]|uniref:sensor histidine kinase n=1 Tax=Paenibacillus sp. FSL R5-0744 TaxID=2921656 RepID=UPI0030DCD065